MKDLFLVEPRESHSLGINRSGLVIDQINQQAQAGLAMMLKRRYDYGTSEALLHKLHPDRKKLFRSPLTPASGFLAICSACLSGSPFPLFVSLACIAFDSAGRRFTFARRHHIALRICCPFRAWVFVRPLLLCALLPDPVHAAQCGFLFRSWPVLLFSFPVPRLCAQTPAVVSHLLHYVLVISHRSAHCGCLKKKLRPIQLIFR
jgi:hypothetical protein